MLCNKTVRFLGQNGQMNTWLSSSNARKHKGNCKGISSYYQKELTGEKLQNMKERQKLLKSEWRAIDELKQIERNLNLGFMGRKLLQ